MKRKNIKLKNPFRRSFYIAMSVGCIILSMTFLCINWVSNSKKIEKNAQEKVGLLMDEWEIQLQQMKNIALDIVSNYEFYPSYYEINIVNELNMLKTFKQYAHQISITKNYFLDYGGERIYKSSGGTIDFNLFLREKSTNEEELQRFRTELRENNIDFGGIVGEPRVISISDEIYVLIPFEVGGKAKDDIAVLGFEIEKNSLKERFDIACGGLEGHMTLYCDDEIIYFTEKNTQKKYSEIKTVLQSGNYMIRYEMQEDLFVNNSVFLLIILLFLLDGFIVIGFSELFAKKTYAPLKKIEDKFLEGLANFDKGDSLEKVEAMLDAMKEQNDMLSLRVLENKKMIRDQVLKSIIEGWSFEKSYPQLERADVFLPGPLYCVIGVFFCGKNSLTREVLSKIQKEVETLMNEEIDEYIYGLCDFENKILWCICSNVDTEAMNSFIEMLCEIIPSIEDEIEVGVGGVYDEFEKVTVSWMESMEIIRMKKEHNSENNTDIFVYDFKKMQQILGAMGNGDERLALEKLEAFVNAAGTDNISMLMLHVISADFLSGVRDLCDKCNIDVAKLNVGLFVPINRLSAFESAAKRMILDFVKCYDDKKQYKLTEEGKRICKYIEAHFAEYDISCENVAEHFGVGRAVVRQAVQAQVGKTYRDYIVFLRIEYAKDLLLQGDVSVAELCVKVGYGNVSHFVKLFREVTGVTPARYRKMVSD